jgi:transposase-like protein
LQAITEQNAQAYMPRENMKPEVAADRRAVFSAPDLLRAQTLLSETVAKYQMSAPKLTLWLEATVPESRSVFAFPKAYRRLLRTSNGFGAAPNGLERVNKEVRRRFRVVGSFVSEASCLRLATAILMEISDEWQAGKVYLTLERKP